MGLFFRPFLHSPVHPHMAAPTESLQLRGILKGHGGWVTSIATTSENPDSLLTGSRDKTLILWTLTRGEGSDYGQPKKVLKGHSHLCRTSPSRATASSRCPARGTARC